MIFETMLLEQLNNGLIEEITSTPGEWDELLVFVKEIRFNEGPSYLHYSYDNGLKPQWRSLKDNAQRLYFYKYKCVNKFIQGSIHHIGEKKLAR